MVAKSPQRRHQHRAGRVARLRDDRLPTFNQTRALRAAFARFLQRTTSKLRAA